MPLLYHKGHNSNVSQRTLSDIRDGEKYRIRKLADGNCWMTENLRLTLTAGQSIEISDGTTWLPTNYDGTTTGATTMTWADLGQNIWKSSGASAADSEIVRSFNTAGLDGKNLCYTELPTGGGLFPQGTDPCYETAFTNDGEEQRVGVYYNPYTATAGRLGFNSGIVPTVSICPRSWSLPLYTSSSQPSFKTLIYDAYGMTSSTERSAIFAFPFSYVKSGSFVPDGESPSSIRQKGFFLTPNSVTKDGDSIEYRSLRYLLAEDDGVTYTASVRKRRGMSVRCVIKGV